MRWTVAVGGVPRLGSLSPNHPRPVTCRTAEVINEEGVER